MTFFIVANMIYFEKKIAFLALHEDIKQKGFSWNHELDEMKPNLEEMDSFLKV